MHNTHRWSNSCEIVERAKMNHHRIRKAFRTGLIHRNSILEFWNFSIKTKFNCVFLSPKKFTWNYLKLRLWSGDLYKWFINETANSHIIIRTITHTTHKSTQLSNNNTFRIAHHCSNFTQCLGIANCKHENMKMHTNTKKNTQRTKTTNKKNPK